MPNLIGTLQVKSGISTNDESLKSVDAVSEIRTVTEVSEPSISEYLDMNQSDAAKKENEL